MIHESGLSQGGFVQEINISSIREISLCWENLENCKFYQVLAEVIWSRGTSEMCCVLVQLQNWESSFVSPLPGKSWNTEVTDVTKWQKPTKSLPSDWVTWPLRWLNVVVLASREDRTGNFPEVVKWMQLLMATKFPQTPWLSVASGNGVGFRLNYRKISCITRPP